MSLKKFNMINESASIGEELLKGSPLSKIERKCLVVRQVVQDGDFSLEEALEIYQVSRADFDDFIAKYLLSVLEATITPSTPNKVRMMMNIEILTNMYKRLFFGIDKDAASILEHFDTLSRNVEEGIVRV